MEAFTTKYKSKVVNKMQGLIISNGSINDYEKLIKIFEVSDYVVCADGGIRYLRKINKTPNIILGDFDSVSKEDLEYIKSKNIETHKFPPIKDKTDTELALDYLIDIGCMEIYLFGATGSRMDHTLANIFLLNILLEKGIRGIIVDDKNEIYIEDDFLELRRSKDSFISIIPIDQEGIRISISGFFYNLEDVLIPFGSTHGISNEIVEDKCSIKIHKGKAIIIQSID